MSQDQTPKPAVKIKTVSVTYDRKVNLGDYNSMNVSVTLWADVNDEETSLHEIMESLWGMAKSNVKEQITFKKKANPNINVSETYLGLPVRDNTESDGE